MNLKYSKNNHKFCNISIKDFSKTQEINNNAFIFNAYNYQNGINNNNILIIYVKSIMKNIFLIV